jgi:hypothetical protein
VLVHILLSREKPSAGERDARQTPWIDFLKRSIEALDRLRWSRLSLFWCPDSLAISLLR